MATGYESDVLLHKVCLWLRVPVFHASLPQYLIDDLKCVQKRALSICPTLSDDNALASLDLELLVVHRQSLCQSLFENILEGRDHRLEDFVKKF